MANIQQIKNEAMATIDAALSILDKYPELDEGTYNLDANLTLSPFSFLTDIFKSVVGRDILIKIVSDFVASYLPALELAIKGVLMSNIKNLLSCSINPYISDDLLLSGVIFNLEQIDIADTLRYSPLSSKGKYFYFGCDACQNADDIRNTAYSNSDSKDMNALLWFMKNRASRREVWGKQGGRDGAISSPAEKKDGVLTLEYCSDPKSIKNAEGGEMSVQTPGNGMLHVFIGNAAETSDSVSTVRTAENAISEIQEEIQEAITQEEDLNVRIQETKEQISTLENAFSQASNVKIKDGLITIPFGEAENAVLNSYKKKLEDLNDELDGIKSNKTTLTERKTNFQKQLSSDTKDYRYRSIHDNFYYRKTLIEFNYDYIMSLKLFDEKVIAAQLLNQITGMLTIDLNLSYKQILIREEIKKMLTMIIETDDVVVSDCFFSFSNADYDKMLQKADLQKAGLFTLNGEQNSISKIDAQSILDSINGIDSSASKETVQSIIEGSIKEVSGTVSSFNYEDKDQINFGVRMNFLESLMHNLSFVITSSVLSPKVYLLMLVNIRLLGENSDFNLDEFLIRFSQLIEAILREIRDRILQYLVDELMKWLSNIAKEIAVKIGFEQAKHYARLIKHIMDCLKNKKGNLDFNIDDPIVDIYDDENEQPKNSEC